MVHVLLAAVLVGPQILLFLAVTPASWLIDDDNLRSSVIRVITRRFAVLSVIALVGLLATGLFQFYSPEIVPPSIQDDMSGYRWGMIFMVKMTLFLVLIAMIGVHAAVIGRRMRAITERVQAGTAERYELERARRDSLLFSGLMVLVSISILCLGVLLAYPPVADMAL
jgi:uncharacterized membrane protein